MIAVPKRLIALTIAFISLITMSFVVAPVAPAGESANLLVQKLGLDLFPSFRNPVYGWVVALLGQLAGSHAVYAVNFFSALCGALLLGLVFSFVYHATRRYNQLDLVPHWFMHRIQAGAGLAAVLYLLASSSFWQAATRAHPLTFDLLLVLAPFYLVVTYTGKSGASRILLASLLYGVAMVEFSTAILLGPVFALAMLVQLYQTGTMRPSLVGQAAGCGLLGLSLYLVQAGLFTMTPTYEWREFKGFFQVIWYIWIDQYHLFTRGLPRVGWLTIGLVSFLPWVITSFFPLPFGANRTRSSLYGAVALNGILLGLGVFLLHDVPLAPVNITGSFRLFLTPYLFVAFWFGNIFAFWMVFLLRIKRFESPGMLKTRKALGLTLATAVPVYLLVVMATTALPSTSSRNDRLVQQFVEALVDNASGKEWLVTNTLLDDQIALEIHRRELPINMIRLGYGRSTAMMQYIASLFSAHPRLESLARVGMEPLMDQWFVLAPETAGKVAIVGIPDIWLNAGLEAVPHGLVFDGFADIDAVPLDDMLAIARDLWAGPGADIATAAAATNQSVAGLSVGWMNVHISKTANNLGVLMENAGRLDDAATCYRQARTLVPDNLSALMNLHVLAQREQWPEYQALEEELIEKTKDMTGRLRAVSLSQVYGYVRVPEAFVSRGISMAASGRSRQAIGEMKRALSLREGNPRLQLAIADLYFGQQNDAESAGYYKQVLEKDAGNTAALLGLMRLATRQGDFDASRRLLARLKEAGASPLAVRMEEAVLEALSGSSALALSMLRDVTKEYPENLGAWTLLAAVAQDVGDQKTLDGAVKKLEEENVYSPAIQLMMAQSAFNRRDRDRARNILAELLRRQPGNIQALEMRLRMDLSESNRDEAQRTVERILNVDPRNAFANYMLGVHHYYREEYLLAESAYRASIQTRASPEALNDLAYVLYLQGRVDEAEKMVKKSLDMNRENSAAWDTLGAILMARNQLTDAEAALQQSLVLRADAPSVMLTMALLYEKQERLEDARQLVGELEGRLNELGSQHQGDLRNLSKRLSDRM